MLPTFRVGRLSAINPFQRLLCRRAHRPASPTQLLTDDFGLCHVDKTNCHSVILGKPPRFMSSKRNSSCCSVPSLPNWTRFSRLNRVPLYSLDYIASCVDQTSLQLTEIPLHLLCDAGTRGLSHRARLVFWVQNGVGLSVPSGVLWPSWPQTRRTDHSIFWLFPNLS